MPSLWEKLQRDFPIVRQYTYLDHAAGGPMPRPVSAAITQYYREQGQQADFAWNRWIKRREKARQAVARFIGADPEEIGFTQSTSHGMNAIAEVLAAQGAVLTNDLEFPASTLPWLWRKVRVVFQKSKEGRVDIQDLCRHLTPAIKTIVTSYVQYATGFRQSLDQLGKAKQGRYLVINATQGFGVFPIDVRACKIDFLCSNSYKWLMAGYGGGILYIAKRWLRRFRPASVGWRSMKDPGRMDNRRLDIRNEAARIEMGCPAFPTIFAVGAACNYLIQIGIERIARRVLALTGYLIERLAQAGYEVLSPLATEERSGIVVFRVPRPERLWKRLLGDKIYVSVRGGGIRVAPHFYNRFEDIDVLMKKVIQYT